MNSDVYLFDYLKKFNSQSISPVFQVLEDKELNLVSVKTDRSTCFLLFNIKISRKEGEKIIGEIEEILFHHDKFDPIPVNCLSLTSWSRRTEVSLELTQDGLAMIKRH